MVPVLPVHGFTPPLKIHPQRESEMARTKLEFGELRVGIERSSGVGIHSGAHQRPTFVTEQCDQRRACGRIGSKRVQFVSVGRCLRGQTNARGQPTRNRNKSIPAVRATAVLAQCNRFVGIELLLCPH